MTQRSLHTTVPVGAITPKLPPWAGPIRIATASRTTPAGSGAPFGIKWPDALGD